MSNEGRQKKMGYCMGTWPGCGIAWQGADMCERMRMCVWLRDQYRYCNMQRQLVEPTLSGWVRGNESEIKKKQEGGWMDKEWGDVGYGSRTWIVSIHANSTPSPQTGKKSILPSSLHPSNCWKRKKRKRRWAILNFTSFISSLFCSVCWYPSSSFSTSCSILIRVTAWCSLYYFCFLLPRRYSTVFFLSLYFTGSFEEGARRMTLNASQKKGALARRFFDACSLFCCHRRCLHVVHDTSPPITNDNRTVLCAIVAHWPEKQASSASLPISRSFYSWPWKKHSSPGPSASFLFLFFWALL